MLKCIYHQKLSIITDNSGWGPGKSLIVQRWSVCVFFVLRVCVCVEHAVAALTHIGIHQQPFLHLSNTQAVTTALAHPPNTGVKYLR